MIFLDHNIFVSCVHVYHTAFLLALISYISFVCIVLNIQFLSCVRTRILRRVRIDIQQSPFKFPVPFFFFFFRLMCGFLLVCVCVRVCVQDFKRRKVLVKRRRQILYKNQGGGRENCLCVLFFSIILCGFLNVKNWISTNGLANMWVEIEGEGENGALLHASSASGTAGTLKLFSVRYHGY